MPPQQIALAVDAVVFGYQPQVQLHVLLIRRAIPPQQGAWALPGGFVKAEEALEAAVERELREESGAQVDYLEQLYTFGDPGRDPRQRVVTVAYYGLARPSQVQLAAASDAAAAAWHPVHELPALAFDHSLILAKALERLRAKITYEPVGFGLLEPQFLFSDLEHLYATLLGRTVDRRNFKKKMLSLGLVQPLPERRARGTGRPGQLYAFNAQRYQALKEQGLLFNIWD